MVHGSLWDKLLLFSIPLIFSYLLQLFFNAADVIVIGRFVGAKALAAVGSTSAFVSLMISLAYGVSQGVNIVVAREYAAGNREKVKTAVHTTVFTGIVSGLGVGIIAILATRMILQVMKTPDDIIDMSALYLWIYFLGLPFVTTYNFGSAILRSIGDTKRPLMYLMISGLINVILNLVLVIFFRMGVAGVGIATTVSNLISSALVINALIHEESVLRLIPSELRLNLSMLKEIMHLGLPSGIQSCIFAFSNILIQSSVNSFGSVVMAGNAIAQNLEGFQYTVIQAYMAATLTFASQNIGAHQYGRIRKVMAASYLEGFLLTLAAGLFFIAIGKPALSLYNTDPEVIAVAFRRVVIILLAEPLEIFMGCGGSVIKALGHPIDSMLTSLAGACLFRVIWIFTVFRTHHIFELLLIVYPISYILTGSMHYLNFLRIKRKEYPKEDM